jgi:hypothetical protein
MAKESLVDFLFEKKKRAKKRRANVYGDIGSRIMSDHPSTMPDYLKIPRRLRKKKPSTLFY